LVYPAPETNLHGFEQGLHQPVVGNLKGGRTLLPISVNDGIEVSHSHQLLNGINDIVSNLELGAKDMTNRGPTRLFL
tara:strand:+ start:50 stop:280 length:231 start_codon:yes stop_codon:yes gene_type:complete